MSALTRRHIHIHTQMLVIVARCRGCMPPHIRAHNLIVCATHIHFCTGQKCLQAVLSHTHTNTNTHTYATLSLFPLPPPSQAHIHIHTLTMHTHAYTGTHTHTYTHHACLRLAGSSSWTTVRLTPAMPP